MNHYLARIVVWTIILLVIVADVAAYEYRGQTVSAYVRALDVQLGGLLRWVWLALWLHFFVQVPWGGWNP